MPQGNRLRPWLSTGWLDAHAPIPSPKPPIRQEQRPRPARRLARHGGGARSWS